MNPFADQAENQVSHTGEGNLIRLMTAWLCDCNPPPPHGIGDDAAIITTISPPLAITKDCLVYNKHFDENAPPELAGAKLINRNISDLAAMGAVPSHGVIACLLPPMTSLEWLRQFYAGLNQTAGAANISIVGGDISSTFNDLAFTLTLMGNVPGRLLTRKSGRSGDTVWVTGTLGGSMEGKHLHFKPRLDEGLWLAQRRDVTSAMDVSDGLATDLDHLCPEDCRVEVDTQSLPLSTSISQLPGEAGIQHALTDGEDYELLFTVDFNTEPETFSADWKKQFSIPLTCIGKLSPRASASVDRIQYLGGKPGSRPKGYEHF